MIRYLQPFTEGINLPFGVSNLKVLDKLSSIEKHRHLILAVIASKGIRPLESGINHHELDDSNARQPFEGSFVIGRIEPGKVLLLFNNADTEIRPSLKVDASVGNIELPMIRFRPLPHILERCLCTVKGSVEFLTTPMGNGFIEAQGQP